MGITSPLGALVGTFGTQEMLLVALVALLLFGGKKIGDIGKGLGEGIRNFRDGMKSDNKEKKE
jgi:sec-independent protein translocase protein TatA